MLSSQILRPLHGTGKSWASRSFDAFFELLNNIYERLLRWTLQHKFLMIACGLVAIILGVFLFNLLPSELVPVEDRGVGFGIVIAPEGATLEYTDSYVKDVKKSTKQRFHKWAQELEEEVKAIKPHGDNFRNQIAAIIDKKESGHLDFLFDEFLGKGYPIIGGTNLRHQERSITD